MNAQAYPKNMLAALLDLRYLHIGVEELFLYASLNDLLYILELID